MITRERDYSRIAELDNMIPSKHYKKPLKPGYDAHFACVASSRDFQAAGMQRVLVPEDPHLKHTLNLAKQSAKRRHTRVGMTPTSRGTPSSPFGSPAFSPNTPFPETPGKKQAPTPTPTGTPDQEFHLQLEPEEEEIYYEMVVKNEAQCLPRFFVFFRKRREDDVDSDEEEEESEEDSQEEAAERKRAAELGLQDTERKDEENEHNEEAGDAATAASAVEIETKVVE